jgi:hypothetical protein
VIAMASETPAAARKHFVFMIVLLFWLGCEFFMMLSY